MSVRILSTVADVALITTFFSACVFWAQRVAGTIVIIKMAISMNRNLFRFPNCFILSVVNIIGDFLSFNFYRIAIGYKLKIGNVFE